MTVFKVWGLGVSSSLFYSEVVFGMLLNRVLNVNDNYSNYRQIIHCSEDRC